MVSALCVVTRPGLDAGAAGRDPVQAAASLGASSQVRADEVKVSWRPSRHARRLLTLAAAALLLALLTRNPALAGVAGPPLLLLGMARVRGSGRPERLGVRVGLTSARMYEGEPVAVDVSVADDEHDARWAFEPGRGIEPGSAVAVNGSGGAVHVRGPALGQARGRQRHPRPSMTAGGWPKAGSPSPSRPSTATRPRPSSAPRSCCPGCRTASASTGPGCLATGRSSTASASSSPATGSARSTGRPPPALAASR